MKIKTNNIPRKLINYFELPEKVQKDYSYDQNSMFFKYKTGYWSLSEFIRFSVPDYCQGFHGGDDYGKVVKILNDETIIVGHLKND